MANEEQVSILKKGYLAWNKWREEEIDPKAADFKFDPTQTEYIEADISGVDLYRADLLSAQLRRVNLNRGSLVAADIRRADLSNADLSSADLTSADLRDANLSSANLQDAHLYKANLQGADLYSANLDSADLREANLCKARLSQARLIGAYLFDANLTDAFFVGANLYQANLSRANLSRATFLNANLSEVSLFKTEFTSVTLGSTIFGNVDLSGILELENAIHRGPSTIGLDTIAKSKGRIPEVFLRGCGLGDWEIEVTKLADSALSDETRSEILKQISILQANRRVQISPLFISYSHGDGMFVDKVERHLDAMSIRFWRDIHDMKAGRIEKQIDRAISQGRTVLLILSKHSLSSDWVEHEVRTARGLEKDMGRDVLCPIALDDSWKSSRWPKRIMEQIMEYNILDFSGWEDDVKFEGMFRKLIDGLELFYKG